MIDLHDGCAKVNSAMTLASATTLLEEGVRLLGGATTVTAFDLSAVTEVDSSGLAVVFGWLREAQRQGKTIRIDNLPASLTSLAQVYGVNDLLPVAQ